MLAGRQREAAICGTGHMNAVPARGALPQIKDTWQGKAAAALLDRAQCMARQDPDPITCAPLNLEASCGSTASSQPRAMAVCRWRSAQHYRYRLSVPKVQKDEAKGTVTRLDSALHAAMTRALAQVSSEVARDVGPPQDKPLCPVPDTVKDDDRDAY